MGGKKQISFTVALLVHWALSAVLYVACTIYTVDLQATATACARLCILVVVVVVLFNTNTTTKCEGRSCAWLSG